MEINIMNQLRETAKAFGVNCTVLYQDSNWEYEWDSRIYKAMGVKVIYDAYLENAEKMCVQGGLYVARDLYEIVMMTFLYEGGLVAIGPFITATTEEILPLVAERNEIPEEKAC